MVLSLRKNSNIFFVFSIKFKFGYKNTTYFSNHMVLNLLRLGEIRIFLCLQASKECIFGKFLVRFLISNTTEKNFFS